MAAGQLLLVDSDEEVRDSLRVALECEGFAVSSVGTGPGAIHRYAAGLFDLVLLDVGHGGQTGWELLEQLRGVNPGVGVVLMSVRSDLRFASAVTGVLAVCEKPLALAALVEVLHRLMAGNARGPRGPSQESVPIYLATG